MKTEELIAQLAGAAGPVVPLRPPAIRLCQWMAGVLAVATLCVFVIGPRADLSSALGSPGYSLSLILLLVSAQVAAAAALVLSVPGAERSWLQRGLPLVTVFAWPVVWVVSMAVATGPQATKAPAPFHWACAIEIVALTAVSGWALLGMVRRAAPLRLVWASATATLAAVASAAAATQLICPISDPTHQLVGHVLVAALVGAAGVLFGRKFLGRW